MPGMAARAASLAAVRIYSSDSDVWPGIFFKFTVLDFHFCAVAIVTAGRPLDIIVQSVIEPRIDFPDNLTSVGMFAPGVFCGFRRMSSGAVFWRNNGADLGFAIFEMVFARVHIACTCGMTIQTGNISMGVPAVGPVADNASAFFGMAFDTASGIFRNASFDAIHF